MNLEFWTVENTGWSNGVSWFKIGGSISHPLRFRTASSARAYALTRRQEFSDPITLWKVVHTTIERFENKEVTTTEWTVL